VSVLDVVDEVGQAVKLDATVVELANIEQKKSHFYLERFFLINPTFWPKVLDYAIIAGIIADWS
jgi:hypothetical protein